MAYIWEMPMLDMSLWATVGMMLQSTKSCMDISRCPLLWKEAFGSWTMLWPNGWLLQWAVLQPKSRGVSGHLMMTLWDWFLANWTFSDLTACGTALSSWAGKWTWLFSVFQEVFSTFLNPIIYIYYLFSYLYIISLIMISSRDFYSVGRHWMTCSIRDDSLRNSEVVWLAPSGPLWWRSSCRSARPENPARALGFLGPAVGLRQQLPWPTGWTSPKQL